MQAEFLARATAAGDLGSEFTIVATDTDPGGVSRGWRFDLNVGLSGRSFLLTPDGRWCSAVRTGIAEASAGASLRARISSRRWGPGARN